MKTSDLIGPALDWAVAKCEGAMAPLGNVMLIGKQLFISVGSDPYYETQAVTYSPSTDWSQGGPIIEREKISIIDVDGYDFWKAEKLDQNAKVVTGYGPTPLVAAMRCYVVSKLGNEVEIPEELI